MAWTGTGTTVSSPGSLGTITRAEIRRAICRELQMPFMRRMQTGYSTATASSTPTLTFTDAALTQEDDYWNGHWWYSVTNDEVRKVTDFRADTNTIKLEYAATSIDTSDAYELHSVWNAIELHAAINRAIEDAFPAFFDYVTDETLVFREDTLKYALSSLSYAPWRILKIWAELNESKITGTATSGTTSTLVNSAGPFGSVAAGWLMSIYYGTGAGQLRTVSTASSTSLTPTVNWTTAPDSTSKYAVWNPDEQTVHWEQVLSASFDAKEYPSYIYLNKQFSDSFGLRMRLEYTHKPTAMTSDASVTAVPMEFLISKTLSILFGQKVNDNRADRARYTTLEEYRRQLAEQYRQVRSFQQPDATVWLPPQTLLSRYNMENPF